MSISDDKESLDLLKKKNEIELQEIEKKVKLKELNKKTFLQPTTVTILVALLSLLGAAITNYYQRQSQMEIEEKKFQYSVYQKALEAKDNITAAKILDFYIKAGILPGEEGKFTKLLQQGDSSAIPLYGGIYKGIELPAVDSSGPLTLKNNFLAGKGTKYHLSYNALNRIDKTDLTTIVIHCSFTKDIQRTASYLADTVKGNSSAHILIDRDGKIIQQVPFNFQSFHTKGYNDKSIGIELINQGSVTVTNGIYKTAYGVVIDSSLVECADGKNCWEKYTPKQIETALAVCRLLKSNYNIKEIAGHNDLDKLKQDPGPFFPIEKFKALLK